MANIEKSLKVPEPQRQYKELPEEFDVNQNGINHSLSGYVPGKPYQDFLKEKSSPSFINYMDNIKRLLGMNLK